MAPAANDVIDTCEACPINGMTVIELGIFLSVHRSRQPLPSQDICDVVNGWFADTVSCASIDSATLLMRRRGWLAGTRCGFWATEQGRAVARPVLHGIVNMLDQGTRLLDVALMMSLLRLTKKELDSAIDL